MDKKDKLIVSLRAEIDRLKGDLLLEKTLKERARQERAELSKALALLNGIHDKMVAENRARFIGM